MLKKPTNNTKIIIILSIAAVLIVFATNVLPDMIDEKPATTDEYHYETTFPVARPPPLQESKEDSAP